MALALVLPVILVLNIRPRQSAEGLKVMLAFGTGLVVFPKSGHFTVEPGPASVLPVHVAAILLDNSAVIVASMFNDAITFPPSADGATNLLHTDYCRFPAVKVCLSVLNPSLAGTRAA